MHFYNFGGIHQFIVQGEADLARIDVLDPARWAATSAPLKDLHCDPAFLAALDPSNTGRIRVSQLITARDWLFERLSGRRALGLKSEVLSLADLNLSSEQGRKLHGAAERLLRLQGAAETTALSLSTLRAFRATAQKLPANGDGVVPPSAIPEPAVAGLAKHILATVGGRKDGSGDDGVGQAELDAFITQAKGFLAWRAKAVDVSPWQGETASAAAQVAALDAKVEEYFWHCDLLAQQAPAHNPLQLDEKDLKSLASRDAAAIEQYLAGTPLAQPHTEGPLNLGPDINPVYREWMQALSEKVLPRALGRAVSSLTRADWRRVKALFEPFLLWQKEKPKQSFEDLGEEALKALLDGPLPGLLSQYIEKDSAAAAELALLAELEQVLLFQRWLVELTNNFVNFSAIYNPKEQALVEVGSLVLDARRLDFCVKVVDRAGHKKVAGDSYLFLIYAQVFEKDTDAAVYEIMAPITAGERGRLRIGKRGLFIDTAGKEFDAVIVDLVENPISVLEAAFAPFRRGWQFVSKKVGDWFASRQAAREQSMLGNADQSLSAAEHRAELKAQEIASVQARRDDRRDEPLNVNSLVLGGGIALAGIGALLASVVSTLTSLKGWLAILAVLAVVAALSGLVGWLRLRRRDMSLLFEASGWAVNVRMKINRRIGRVFTFIPALPPGAVVERRDALTTPEDRRRVWRWIVTLLVLSGAGGFALVRFILQKH